MGCGCNKNKFPKKKSSRMPVKTKKMTFNERKAKIIKIQNNKKGNTQSDWEKFINRKKVTLLKV